MFIGINVEHPVAHVRTQNGLAESFIKRLQLISRPLLRELNSLHLYEGMILHAASFLRIRPATYHKYSSLQLTYDHEPNISHLRFFGYAIYVLIAPPQHTKMSSQRRLGIYVGFDSPSTIKYLEPLMGDAFTTRFADCHFNETNFPTFGR